MAIPSGWSHRELAGRYERESWIQATWERVSG
jgi:hypothetical protein